MLLFCAVVAALVAATSSASPAFNILAAKETIHKQKSILDLIYHFQQPLINPKLIEIAKNFHIDENTKMMYQNKENAMRLWELIRRGDMLPRGKEFSPIDMDGKLEDHTHAVIDLLIDAKDWDTFYTTAVWARQNINEGIFMYSLAIAMARRDDCKDLILPPAYEVQPNMFFRSEVMQKAYDARMVATDKDEKETAVIDSHFYDWFHPKMMPENRMTYFTEDVNLNAWNWELQTKMDAMLYKWMGNGDDVHPQLNLFYPYIWKWMINRYNLEKMSNNLPEVERLALNENMMGHVPHLRLKNGKEIPMRPAGVNLMDAFDSEIDELKHSESFLKSIFKKDINSDMILKNGKAPIMKHLTIIREKLYSMLGKASDPKKTMNLAPGAIMFFETQLRDPVYYKMLLRMIDFVLKVSKVRKYEMKDVLVPGVKIESLETDKLLTFFETFDVELNNGLEARNMDSDKKMGLVVARHSRLNHLPFSYRMSVESSMEKKVQVRVFIGPMRDSSGINMTMQERAPLMVEIDRFTTALTSGKNKIERSSKNFPFFEEDKDSYRTMQKKLEDAIQGRAAYFHSAENNFPHIRYPANLLLPKGKKNGMSYSLFAMIVNKNEHTDEETVEWIGFPFDSYFDFAETDIPSMFSKEVIIYHKKTDEIVDSS